MEKLKICFISKYPPIEGGESSKAYWLIRGLAKRGHEIHVVTNSIEVENEYRENITGEDLDNYKPKNVFVYNTDPFSNPRFIPFTNPYSEKLTSIALEVIRNNDIDLIDSWYLLPYGVAGLIIKLLRNKPLIMRHAGSDMNRLFGSSNLSYLLLEIFRNSNKIVTHPSTKDVFLKLGVSKEKIFLNNPSVDVSFFNDKVKPIDLQSLNKNLTSKKLTIITFIGKTSRSKGVFDLINALKGIKKEFLLLLVVGGTGLDELRNSIRKNNLSKKTRFMNFVPPWRIPSIIKASTCVVCPERKFPIATHYPILPREVMSVGTCLILSRELYEKYPRGLLHDGRNVIVIHNPQNKEEFAKIIEEVLSTPKYPEKIGKEGNKLSRKIEDFDRYVKETEKMYRQVLLSKNR